MRCLLLILTLLSPGILWAQTLNGRVTGKDGEPLIGATVVATTEGGTTVAYCITADKGAFRLTVTEGRNPARVTVSYMGYEKKTLPFSEMKEGMTIRLSEGGFKLKEVKVKAQRIKSAGDTLTYSVSGFKQGQDRSISDVISKMPGLEVKADGKIEYQGKAINKFYIEGKDLMGSQYGVVSENIKADQVKSVQVLENHQAVKSLRGVSFSEQAALNLVLKDEAKDVWNGSVDLGLGYGDDFLYDCRLMGMQFNKRFQTLMMYKNNSLGRLLDNEVFDLASYLRGHASTEQGLLSLMSVAAPDLARDRYTFNQSHLVAGNWLWKTGKDSDLRLQANGFLDRTEMQNHTSTTYLTLADLPVVLEEQEVTNTRSEWKGEANYQYNGSKTYIKNNLKGYMDWNKSVGSMTYNGVRTDLRVKPHKRYLTEDFQLSHTTGKGDVYNVDSYWAYNSLPGQQLTINGQTERLNLDFFSTQNDVQFKKRLGQHYLNNELGLDYDHQRIGVALDAETEQSSVYELLRVYWTPSMTFRMGKHRLDVKAMLSYAHQTYKEAESSQVWLDPTVSWNWKAHARSEFSASVSYKNAPLMGKGIYDTPIFTGYRTQKTNRGETEVQHTWNATAAYKYSNPVAGLFFNLRPMYTRVSGNLLYESGLNGNIYSLTATDRDYALQTVGVSANVSKTFSWAKSLVGLSASHNISDYSLLVSQQVNEARMNSTSVGLNYSLRPVRLLSIEGHSNVNLYRQQNLTRRELSSGSTTDWQHFLNLHVFPADQWMVSLKNELFHTSEEGIGVNYFLDFSVSYKAKRWELALLANNLMGTSEFERRTLGNTVESYAITRLRPREFLIKWSFDL